MFRTTGFAGFSGTSPELDEPPALGELGAPQAARTAASRALVPRTVERWVMRMGVFPSAPRGAATAGRLRSGCGGGTGAGAGSGTGGGTGGVPDEQVGGQRADR